VKAAVYHGRRDVRIEDVRAPDSPGAGELLLDVEYAAICGTDASEWAHGPFFAPLDVPHPFSGHHGPLVMGHEFIGRIAALGEGVDDLAIGDLVASGAGVWCGECRWCLEGRTNLCARYYTLGLHTDGGLAEQVRVPAKTCKLVPDGLSPVAAALAQPVAVALHAVRRARLGPEDHVAVVGVGGIGAFVLAAARFFGAGRIIAVDIDADRLTTASRLGATDVVDAGKLDLVTGVGELTGGSGVDVVIEASGAPSAPQDALNAVRRGGKVLMVGLQAAPRELDLHAMTLREVDMITTNAHVCDVDLPDALRLLASGDLAQVVTAGVIELDELVAEGLERLASGTAGGKIVVDPRKPAVGSRSTSH
jgi:threonine dehydrogenase-like Zn-dependent dehydrogenase